MLAIESPYPIFLDTDGTALDGGYLYFGVAEQNPETNPIQVYWDAEGTQPAAQPIRTMGGYASRAGTPALVFVAGDYSLTVRDHRRRFVYYRSSQGTPVGALLFFGSNGGDDAPALQAMANANPNRTIVNALSNVLSFYTECRVTADGVVIDLNGGQIQKYTPGIKGLVLAPSTAGVTAAFRNGGGVINGTIDCSPAALAGDGGDSLDLIQCNGARVRDVVFNNGDVHVAGGQLSSAVGCSFFASVGAYKGAGSAMLHFEAAPYGAGQFQKCFTFHVENGFGSASLLRDGAVRVHECDGVTIEGYFGFGKTADILLLSDRDNTYIGPLQLTSGVYVDQVSETSGSQYGVEIRDDGRPTTKVFGLSMTDFTCGNGPQVGLLIRKPDVYDITLTGGQFLNLQSWAIDASGSATMSLTINGTQIRNVGSTGAGGDIRIDGGQSFAISNVIHHSSRTICLQVTGTWRTGSVTGCVNEGGVAADIAYSSATFTTPLQFSGNSSTYVGAPANSWLGASMTLNSYANDAAAAAAGLQLGRLYNDAGGAVRRRIV